MKKIAFLTLIFPALCFALPLPEGTHIVACNKNETYCVAVGRIDKGPSEQCPFGCQQLIAYYFTNGIWESSMGVPQPKSKLGNLNALACSDDMQTCVAVGYQMLSHHYFDKLPYIITTHDGGNIWELNNNALGESFCFYDDFPYSALNAVTCDSLGFRCVAVGFCKTSVQNKDHSFETKALSVTTKDDGMNFKDSNTQPIPLGFNNELLTVECDKELKECIATGFSIDNNSRKNTQYFSHNSGIDWEIMNW